MRAKKFIAPAAIIVTAVLALSACSSGSSTSSTSGSKTLSISAPLGGELGDKSFMDSADAGLIKAQKELGVKIKVVQAGDTDAPAWERNLTEASASGQYGLIVTGGTVVASTLKKVAAKFPKQRYLIFDSPSVGKNVTGISYAQNEGAFLVGALAALITDSPKDFPRATGSKRVGVAGGMDIPVINDFVVGFKQGALAIDPSIKVDVRYINSFSSSQAGYNTAMAQFKAGDDVVYQVAGAAGLGVLQAGLDSGRYAIGTDSDQNGIHPTSTPASAIKAVGTTVYEGIQSYQKGTLKAGATIPGDIKNDGVGLVFNSKLVPASIIAQITALKQQVISGKITVDTALK